MDTEEHFYEMTRQKWDRLLDDYIARQTAWTNWLRYCHPSQRETEFANLRSRRFDGDDWFLTQYILNE